MTKVHIEFHRVQTWLFAVPRLRAMVGANVLLGEMLRVTLPSLARGSGLWTLMGSHGMYPDSNEDDPLKDYDDPAADARGGILSRDGGHFEALFAEGAEEFVEEATRLLHRELPGLRFRISLDGVARAATGAQAPTELPVLAPCEWTGRGLASATVLQGDELVSVSLDVARRHQAARRTENGESVDLVSLLSRRTKLNRLERAQAFKNLVGSGYLALLVADGNGVGSHAGDSEVERASFFHRNRVLLRRALLEAINAVCNGEMEQAPLIPLMLGGDDLLLVCRAETALPFVLSLCDALAALQGEDRINFKLTLGVGVVFAKHTIPIHRLHEVAEQLVTSAKRRFRGLEPDEPRRSIVDWAVYSTAWVDDPEDIRRRDWLRGCGREARVLSQRPVDVLGEDLGTLRGLVNGAAKLSRAPRSQLRHVVEQLPLGRTLSELAFAELGPEARVALHEAGVTEAWRRAANGDPWITELLDLVEISEIARLGRNANDSQPLKDIAHG